MQRTNPPKADRPKLEVLALGRQDAAAYASIAHVLADLGRLTYIDERSFRTAGNYLDLVRDRAFEKPPKQVYGEKPKGILVLTKEGRMIAILTAETLQVGMGDVERANLHRNMIAYSGRYRLQGNEFVTTVDVSWNESWNGSEQKRFWKIEDGKLFIESAPGPSPGYAGRTSFGRLIWEREQ